MRCLLGLVLWIGLPTWPAAQPSWPKLEGASKAAVRYPQFDPVDHVRVEVRADGWTLHAPDRPWAYPAMDMQQVADFMETPEFWALRSLGRELHINPRAGSMHLVRAHIEADPLLPFSSIAPVLKVLDGMGLVALRARVEKGSLSFMTTRPACDRAPLKPFRPITKGGYAELNDYLFSRRYFQRPCHGLTIWLAPSGAWAQWDERWATDASTTSCDGPMSRVSARVLALEESGDAPFTALPLALDPVPVGEKCDVAVIAALPDVPWGAITEALAFVHRQDVELRPRAYVRIRRPGASE